MSGKVWRFSCCQKRKARGQKLSTTKHKGQEINVLSLQSREDNDFQSGGQCELPERTIKEFLNSTPVEQKQAAAIEDQGDHIHGENVGIGVTLNGFDQKDFIDKVSGSVVPPPQWQRDYQLIKKQLEATRKEKHELEEQVLEANQKVRDLRHEMAVLQKRLQVAENRLPDLPPLCPPPPPPLPPLAQPHANPLRALLTVIQKRRSSRDPNICLLQDVGPRPDGPEVTGTEVTYNHQCPGMNEVLEMIRGGVSLRHVIQVHKAGFRTGEDSSELGGSQVVPELQKILKKRKVSADKHVSDGSCDGSMEEDPTAHGPTPPRDDPHLRSSHGERSLQDSHLQESFSGDARGTDCEVGEGQGNGDTASIASTLPLTCPLDQGQVDSVSGSPPADAMDLSNGQLQMTGHADHWSGVTAQETGLEEHVLTADRGVAVDPAVQSNGSPTLQDNSPVLHYLNWEKWSGVDLATLPFKSIFKSVSFLTDSNGGEKVTLQAQQVPEDHKSKPLEALESEHSCPSFGSADFGDGTPDVLADVHRPFSLLHDMLKPPIASNEEPAHALIANEVACVLNPEFLEKSVEEHEPDG